MRTKLYCHNTFPAVYYADFICVLRDVQIIILASFYNYKHRYHMLQFLAPKAVMDAFCTVH